jgi:hypothetical protein
MRTWWLTSITLTIVVMAGSIAGTASAVTVWRWVDQNGVTHYSDRPVEGAEPIELAGAQTFPGTPSPSTAPSVSPQPGMQSGPTRQETQAQAYRRFEIVSPAQQETLWNIGGTLNVSVSLDPPLQAGHRIDVYLDGERRNLGATSTQFSIPEVFRGVHTLQGVIVDESGAEVLRSLAITFMVQQTSILNPNNPTPPARRN